MIKRRLIRRARLENDELRQRLLNADLQAIANVIAEYFKGNVILTEDENEVRNIVGKKIEEKHREFVNAVKKAMSNNEFLEVNEPIYESTLYLARDVEEYMQAFKDRQAYLDAMIELDGEDGSFVERLRDTLDEYEDKSDVELAKFIRNELYNYSWEGIFICREQMDWLIDKANDGYDDMLDNEFREYVKPGSSIFKVAELTNGDYLVEGYQSKEELIDWNFGKYDFNDKLMAAVDKFC